MKKEELLELEALDGPRLAEIAHEKVKGKPTERAMVAEQILRCQDKKCAMNLYFNYKGEHDHE